MQVELVEYWWAGKPQESHRTYSNWWGSMYHLRRGDKVGVVTFIVLLYI